MLRMKLETTPPEIRIIEEKLAELNMKNDAAQSSTTDKLKITRQILADKWDFLRETLKKVSDVRVTIDLLQSELLRVIRLGNFDRAREIESSELAEKKR